MDRRVDRSRLLSGEELSVTQVIEGESPERKNRKDGSVPPSHTSETDESLQ